MSTKAPDRTATADVGSPVSQATLLEATAWRRRLHSSPELAFCEHKTSAFIAEQLSRFGLDVHCGLGGTGVVGTLRRGSSTRAIGIRADMDALPIEEQTGLEYASSVSGVMHACGHDGHVVMALAAARVCAEMSELDGIVHFIFQPAEEGECGARRMIADGLFRRFPCDAIYALHNQPTLPFSACVVRDGTMLAASAIFEIEILGRGCHAGRPQQGTDVILAVCQLVSALQSVVSRNTDPLESAVVSVTQIHSGNAWSALPLAATIRGTTRWFADAVGEILEHRVADLSHAIAAAFGCSARVRYERKYPATINHPRSAQFLRDVVADLPGMRLIDHPPTTGSEDFSEMLQIVPGCYFWLGSGASNAEPSLHSPHYDFNDDLLPIGIALWVEIVRRSLQQGGGRTPV